MPDLVEMAQIGLVCCIFVTVDYKYITDFVPNGWRDTIFAARIARSLLIDSLRCVIKEVHMCNNLLPGSVVHCAAHGPISLNML